MVVLILSITTAFFAVRSLAHWVAVAALVEYMVEKGYTPPSERETKACVKKVLQERFHLRNGFISNED